MHADEQKFILDINTKKESAWEKLYRNYYPALCSYAAQITQDEMIVEDIVQECLITLWNSPITFPDIKNLTGWLYKAVYTRSLNNLRSQARSNRLRHDFWNSLQELTEEEAVNAAIQEEVLHKFRSILTHLSRQQQEIMKMSMEGKKVKEIAALLQVSENAIKMQKKRAYSTIREELGECWSVLLVMAFPNLL